MATIYYPSNASVYTRIISGSGITELFINVAPDTVFFLTGSTYITSSFGLIFISTGSTYPITASWANNSSIAVIVGGEAILQTQIFT